MFTRAKALDAGSSPSDVDRHVGTGRWTALRRGTCAVSAFERGLARRAYDGVTLRRVAD